jgi:transcriptional regulator with GAF, ATPase, and Fis domain
MTQYATARRIDVKDMLEELRKELRSLLDETAGLTRDVKIDPNNGIDMREAVNNYQRDLIVAALRMTRGQQKRAAELLGLKPSTLNIKMKTLGIDPDEI